MSANTRRPLAASLVSASLVLLGLSSSPASAAGQVSGAVVIDGGPVRGQISVGEPAYARRPVIIYQPVRGRRMEVARYVPQVVFIEQGHGRHGKPSAWYKRHGYRPVTLFYSEGRYFTQIYAARGYRWGPQFTPVVVWERGNRFYLPADGGPQGYGYTSSYARKSSHGNRYQQERPNGDGRDWDE